MTIIEMHTAVNLALQKIGSYVIDDFLPEEIDYYLNVSQRIFIKKKFSEYASGQSNKSLIENDLLTLISEIIQLPMIDAYEIYGIGDSEYVLPYPDNMLYFLYADAGITRTANPQITSVTYVPTDRISVDMIDGYRVTAFNKPYIINPKLITQEEFFTIFCDDETKLIDARVKYIRKQKDVLLDVTDTSNNIDSELPDHTHDELVAIAANIMSDDLQRGQRVSK